MTSKAVLGLALALAVVGAITFVSGASQQAICSPAGTGCTQINYTPIYIGIAILVVSAGMVFASSRLKPHTIPVTT